MGPAEFYELLFPWWRQDGGGGLIRSSHHIFDHPLESAHKTGLPELPQRVQKQWDVCTLREREGYEARSWQCVFPYDQFLSA